MTEKKPTLDYAKADSPVERHRMWWAIAVCGAILLVVSGLVLWGAIAFAAIRDGGH